MKELKKFWYGLTAQQQLVIVVILVILIWAMWNSFKTRKDVLERVIKEKTESQVLAGAGIVKSYSDFAYDNFADDLFRAMDGPGTNLDPISKVFGKMKNDADIVELERAFGLRLSSYSSSWVSDPTDLKDWLRSDLSESAMTSLNAQLERQGITKNF